MAQSIKIQFNDEVLNYYYYNRPNPVYPCFSVKSGHVLKHCVWSVLDLRSCVWRTARADLYTTFTPCFHTL